MNEDQAMRAVFLRFPGAEPCIDTSSAGPGMVVDPAGRVWRERCPCGNHGKTTGRGHDAKPVQRERRVS